MTYTVRELRTMRAAKREQILAENPELRKMWESRSKVKTQTVEEVRKEDAKYMKEGKM